jgi:hypothetical protein
MKKVTLGIDMNQTLESSHQLIQIQHLQFMS